MVFFVEIWFFAQFTLSLQRKKFLFGHLQQSHGNENAQIKLFTGKKVARVRTQLGVGNGVFYVPVIGI